MHCVIVTVIGSSWLSPVKEIEFQLTLSGNSCGAAIIIAVTCIFLYQAVLRSQENVLL